MFFTTSRRRVFRYQILVVTSVRRLLRASFARRRQLSIFFETFESVITQVEFGFRTRKNDVILARDTLTLHVDRPQICFYLYRNRVLSRLIGFSKYNHKHKYTHIYNIIIVYEQNAVNVCVYWYTFPSIIL